MVKRVTKILFLLLLLIPGVMYSQNTLIYFEDFEATDTAAIHLNTGDVGTNSGINQWEINNKYIGQPIFPNTISEDSTFGNASITHPDSNYLHIHDVNINTVSNANFDPTAPSDRFTTLGPFCTLGDDNVHFAFFYLCMGNTNSYGNVYYRANSGPWTLASGGPYSNTYKWNYTDITDPAFANVQNLEFGFRWINGNSTDTTSSFAIDDIKLVANYDPAKYPVKISITQIYGAPVCQNNDITIQVNLSAPLCGQGIYQVQLSGPHGNFSNPYNAGNDLLYNTDSVNYLDVHIPSNSPADSCYQIRIIRTDITPFIVSDTSICFVVLQCPNTITTLQPVVLSKPLDTVCVYSVIDVPFLSTGVFVNNIYTAQLSDSTGNFNGNNNVLGVLVSDQTYPGPPGTVSGKIVPSSQPIPPGCHYFIRVISSNPAVTGSLYGPFCIRDCDMETNNTNDIQVCIPPGIDSCIPVHINTYDSTITYGSGNHFRIEVHSAKDFSLIYKGGLDEGGNQGIVVSDKDTCLQMKILDLNYLLSLGLGTGVYYVRIVADSSSEPWNTLGTLIHLTIGSPNPTPLSILYEDPNTFYLYNIPDTSVCIGSTMFYLVDPYNSQSTYQWTLGNNSNWPGEDGSTGIIFNQAGDYTLSAIETNYGCVGPGSDTVHINVRGAPSVSIQGPLQVCIGDTAHYTVPLEDQTYYNWSSPTGSILDTANNNLTITFSAPGVYLVHIHAVGFCGVADGSKSITVKAYPTVNAGNDTTVCKLDTVKLSTVTGGYTYQWYMGNDSTKISGATSSTLTVTPDTTTTYFITSTVTGPAGCKSDTSVTVFVKDPVQLQFLDSICPRQSLLLDPGVTGANYSWSTGATSQTITVDSQGTYTLSFKVDTAICNANNTYKITQYLKPGNTPDTLFLCPGTSVTLDAGNAGLTYIWSTNATTQTISVDSAGNYTLTIIDKDGKCVETGLYPVQGEDCQLHYPNVFTPNGDGFNDKWYDKDSTAFTNFDVKIYDRWGLLMYESSNCNFQWDGKNKQGNTVSDGVYYYLVSASSASIHQELHGTVTVLASKK